jgi:hypothetical protein
MVPRIILTLLDVIVKLSVYFIYLQSYLRYLFLSWATERMIFAYSVP